MKKATTVSHLSRKKDIVRIIVISDTHGEHEILTDLQLPPGDILIHCGDFANKGNKQDVQHFIQWISELSQYPEKYVIDGNHDRTLQKNASVNDCIDLQQMFERSDSVYLLQDEFIETKHGILIYGASWNTCESGSFPHKFNLQPDVFLAHSPPYLSRSITIPQVGEEKSHGWKMSKELANVVLSSVFVNASSLQSQRSDPYMAPTIVIDFDVFRRVPIRIKY